MKPVARRGPRNHRCDAAIGTPERVGLREEFVAIRRRGARVRVPIADEPDAGVLLDLLDRTSDGLALVRRDRIVWANATLAAMVGAPDAKDLCGAALEDVF